MPQSPGALSLFLHPPSTAAASAGPRDRHFARRARLGMHGGCQASLVPAELALPGFARRAACRRGRPGGRRLRRVGGRGDAGALCPLVLDTAILREVLPFSSLPSCRLLSLGHVLCLQASQAVKRKPSFAQDGMPT